MDLERKVDTTRVEMLLQRRMESEVMIAHHSGGTFIMLFHTHPYSCSPSMCLHSPTVSAIH